jgi:phage/plasmid-like protein (TIGR03299 family)
LTETVDSATAARLGGIDFNVEIRPNGFFDSESGKWIPIGNRRTVVRADTLEPLAVVSDDYPVLQYREAFDFMDTINPQYVAAGALRGGRQAFMVVELPDGMRSSTLNDLDPHEMYLVLRTSHDRTRAIEVSMMPLRARCMNQLTLKSFSRNAPNKWSIRHTTFMSEKLKNANKAIANLNKYVDAYTHNVQRLVDIELGSESARGILMSIFPNKPRTEDRIDSILHTWMVNTETVGFNGTGWGLVQAVSEYMEWQRAGGTAESRFIGALEGPTNRTINNAAGILLSRYSAA